MGLSELNVILEGFSQRSLPVSTDGYPLSAFLSSVDQMADLIYAYTSKKRLPAKV